VRDTANGAVLASGTQTQDTKSLWDDDALLLVIWGRDALKGLEAIQSSGTSSSLVWNHAADSSVEDFRGSAKVKGTLFVNLCHTPFPRVCLTSASGVVASSLAHKSRVLYCIELLVSLRPLLSYVDVHWIV
jgi:hypothetical protein